MDRRSKNFALALISVSLVATTARADIYRWEWINPADESQGRQQSAMLTTDGAGKSAYPKVSLSGFDLKFAYLPQAKLAYANCDSTSLQNAYLDEADLRYARFLYGSMQGASLVGANLTFADLSFASVASADLRRANLTAASLYGSDLGGANLTGAQLSYVSAFSASFANANLQDATLIHAGMALAELLNADLRNANFSDAYLDNANFANANLTNATVTRARFISVRNLTPAQFYSTASYVAGDLTGIEFFQNDLAGWSFAGQNLTKEKFDFSNMADVDFSNAAIVGASFLGCRNLSQDQLYSTASYQSKNLQGIILDSQSNWNFAGQDLRYAQLSDPALTNSDLSGADIRYADFRYGNITISQIESTQSYQSRDLTGVLLYQKDLVGIDFSHMNLTNADLSMATIAGVDFTDAEIRGANFSQSDLTAAQLYSTRSYLAKDLTGVNLGGNDIGDWDFMAQKITGANFGGSTLKAAQLYSTASYQNHNLSGIEFAFQDMAGWNLAGMDLRRTTFYEVTLSSTNFTGSDIRNASFSWSALSAQQIYSTASYQAHDLTGVHFIEMNLAGLDFSNQNLAGASFDSSSLRYANFKNAVLTNAYKVWRNGDTNGTNFSGADLRGAEFQIAGATTTNTILIRGEIDGLNLTSNRMLVVRDYDGGSTYVFDPLGEGIPIRISKQMTMDQSGVLRLVFESDEWGSLISFDDNIPVTLGGKLELTFAPGTDISMRLGRTIRIFDWSNVVPIGKFTVESPYLWDLSNLYATGDITLIPEPSAVSTLFTGLCLSASGRARIIKSRRSSLAA